MTDRFEAAWAAWNGAPAVAFSGWAGGALAALDLRGRARARTCCAPRTRSWPRRWPSSGAGGRPVFVDCRRDDLCMSFEDFEAKAERHRPRAAVLVHIGGHLAFETERIAALLPRARDLPARGLRPRARRLLGRPPARHVRRRRRLLVLRDEDHLDRRGRRPGLRRRATCSRYARAFRDYGKPDHAVARPELPDERVHRRDRARPDRAPRGDRRLEERRRPRAPRPAAPASARAARRHGLRALQVHRVRPDRALHRQGVRRALPPHHGRPRRPAEHRLGGGEPLVRPALLPTAPGRHVDGDDLVLVTGGAGLHRLPRRRPPARRRPPPAHPRHAARRRGTTGRGRDRARRRPPPRRRARARCDGCAAICHLAAAADVGEVHAEPAGADASSTRRGTLNVLEAARQPTSSASSTPRRSGSTPTSPPTRSTRTRCCAARATSTRPASSPASCTAAPTPSSTGSSRRSCASASPTARAPAPPRSSRASSTARSRGEPLTIAGSGEQQRALRLRRGPRRGRRGGAGARRGRAHLQPRRARDDHDPRSRRDRPGRRSRRVEIVHTEGRAGDLPAPTIRSDRAERELGWTASTPPFPEGIARYVAWLRSQPEDARAPARRRSPGGRPELARRPRAVLSRLAVLAGEPRPWPAGVALIARSVLPA